MKNMIYCLLCNILLVALVILTSSCGRNNGPASSDFNLDHSSENLYSRPAQIRFNAKTDTLSVVDKVSDRYRNKIMYW